MTKCIAMAVLAILIATPAFAVENLNFSRILSPSETKRLSSYLQDQTTQIAPIDLNQDGILDYILRTGDCAQTHNFCTYKILGDDGETLTDLGSFKARNATLAKSDANGLREIKVYQSTTSDYEHVIYGWSPKSRHYEMTRTKD